MIRHPQHSNLPTLKENLMPVNSINNFTISSPQKIITLIQVGFLLSAFAFLIVYSVYPYIPSEGDPFGCWYDYIRNWKQFSLGVAFRGADATGRYPGYPAAIGTIMGLFGLDFLDALRATRILSVSLTVTGAYAVFSKLEFKRILSGALAIMLLLNPALLGAVKGNTQDSLKSGFFLWFVYFFLTQFGTKSPTIPLQRRINTLALILFAVLLGSLRSVEMVSAIGFILGYYFYSKNSSTEGNSQLRKTSNRRNFLMFVPIIAIVLFIGLLHKYGKNMTGHWGLSGSGFSAHNWTSLYRKGLAENYKDKDSRSSVPLNAIKWPMISGLNKFSLFATSYVFPAVPLSIVPGDSFDHRLTLKDHLKGTPSSYVIALLLISTLGFLGVRSWKRKDETLPWISSSILTAGFWTYGLHHYESRYWTLVYLTTAISLIIPCRNLKKLQWLPYLIILLAAPSIVENMKQTKALSTFRDEQSLGWQNALTPYCSVPNDYLVAIPWDAFAWSSFRYFIAKTCPDLTIIGDRDGSLYPPQLITPEKKVLRMNPGNNQITF